MTNKIAEAFRANAKEFYQHPFMFMREKGMNVAGAGWLAGGIEQLGFSGWNLSSRQLVASAINITSASSNMIFGRGDNGVRAGTFLGEVGAVVTLWPDLTNGDPPTLAGFIPFTIAQLSGFFSPELTKKFEQSENIILRNTLGSPRRILGTINAVSRLPIILHSVMHNQPEIAAPYMTWLIADISATLSKSEVSKTRQSPLIPG